MDEIDLLERLGCSLGIGLLMGLERQREPSAYAGLRTFALVALLGSLCAWAAPAVGAPWIVAVGLFAVTTMIVGAYVARPRDDDPGTTTSAALMLCYVLGVAAWSGQLQLAVGLALAATALLQFKEELHGFATRLTREEVVAVLRLATISALVLPILPNRGYGPYGAFNPYRVWLMVVLVSTIGFFGYMMLRFLHSRRAVGWLGVLGGLASSTATTLGFSRQFRAGTSSEAVATSVILIANLTALVRVLVLAAVMGPDVLPGVVPVFATGLVAGLLALKLGAKRAEDGVAEPPMHNPVDLRGALAFGALFAAVQFAVAALQAHAGDAGVYVAAGVAGLTDLDAIALAVLGQTETQALSAAAAAKALTVAYLANLVFKLGATAVVAGPRLALRVGRGFGAVAAGLLIATLLSGV